MGIRAIITSSSDEKLKRAKALGAALGINYKSTPDWEKAAMEFTGGVGVDHVVEVGGVSGGATELNHALIFARRANVQGISVGSDPDVRSDESRGRGQRSQAGHRQGLRLCRGASGVSAHGCGRAFRKDRHSSDVSRGHAAAVKMITHRPPASLDLDVIIQQNQYVILDKGQGARFSDDVASW